MNFAALLFNAVFAELRYVPVNAEAHLLRDKNADVVYIRIYAVPASLAIVSNDH